MKLTAVLISGVFFVGSAYSMADHRHQDCRHHGGKHHERVHHQAGHGYYQQGHRYRQIDRAHVLVVSGESRHSDGDGAYARVVDVEPVYRYYQAPVTDQSCIRYDQARPNYRSHTGMVLGAVIGGALGHRIGDAHGDPQVAAVAGGLLGASVGRDMDRRAYYNRGLLVEGPCRTTSQQQTRRELVEYNVTYRYNGEIHTARMDYHPGDWVKLDVSVTPA